ncbi:hypothetical protein DL1_00365 [Thioclava dalianensis]|uniref:Uncharacterized protein n=1 Tax=Thioclava dalianensis TaxID=1185766 RepID=A0A074TJH5_9RHOB|nr:hypothetical protein [Thioclava dalianensis]KEP71759.1 hypothetical protein DL1_00365 [Thioclava dalianensis]SFN65034.1 hypothetical protein SAMN05216224_108137 [Thioclava dalianensis]
MDTEQHKAADFGPVEDMDAANMDAAPDDGAAHLADFRAPDIGGENSVEHDVVSAGEEGEQGDELDAAPDLMGKDSFWVVFKAVFQIPGGIVPDFAPLAIQPEEEAIARPAADACHDLLSIYYPKALMPMGDTFALVLTAAPFLMMKIQLVRTILADRAERAQRAAREAQAARYGKAPERKQADNESAPPTGGPSPVSWMDQEAAA